jgi:cytochrome c oxidase cbb3-type subunit I
MNSTHLSAQTSPVAEPTPAARFSAAEIDASCTLPLLTIFISAGFWLVIGSLLGLLATLRFHGPAILADHAWLTYGRVRPAFMCAALYGFCIQAGLGVALWILARAGRTTLAQPWLIFIGAKLWNVGVLVGIIGILAGESTGFENLEMPYYSALILFLGYLMIGVWAVITFHQRAERRLVPSQWFLLAALFWFPWIYTTANMLLVAFPTRGVTQAIIAWWYSNNLLFVWLGLIGLATAFYFVPKFSRRPLHSHYLALLIFWLLILFGSWGGIPNSAPVPAWIPALSTVGTGLTIVPLVAVALIMYGTLGRFMLLPSDHTAFRFILFGIAAFLLWGLMNILSALTQLTDFTWFTTARMQIGYYGFFTMLMFGAIYYIVPQLTGTELPYGKLVRLHYWVAAIGILLIVLPLAIGGLIQGVKLNSNVDFLKLSKGTLMFLRLSTMGDLLLLAGHGFFFVNLTVLAARMYRAQVRAAYTAVTAEIKPAGVQP